MRLICIVTDMGYIQSLLYFYKVVNIIMKTVVYISMIIKTGLCIEV